MHARWAPLLFKGSYWNVAEDELDVVAAYYRLQARNIQQRRVGYFWKVQALLQRISGSHTGAPAK